MNKGWDDSRAEQAQKTLEEIQIFEHLNCIFCGKENPIGLKLDFLVKKRGSVTTTFSCNQLFQSYPEILHGGITSALLDAAMTNCLFSIGVTAVTGELAVRYLNPVDIDSEVEISATLNKSVSTLYYLSAELTQYDEIAVRAKAKFIDRKWAKANRAKKSIKCQ